MKWILNPYAWITIIVVFFILSSFILKIDNINISNIFIKYISNFKNGNGKIPIMIIILYFIVPIALAFSCAKIKSVDDSIIGNITVMLSIITAMLFTLLPLLMELRHKMETKLEKNPSMRKLYKKLVSETVDSILFEVIVAIILLMIVFLTSFPGFDNIVVSFIIYYMLFMFLLNLMIVLKRFSTLFKLEIDI